MRLSLQICSLSITCTVTLWAAAATHPCFSCALILIVLINPWQMSLASQAPGCSAFLLTHPYFSHATAFSLFLLIPGTCSLLSCFAGARPLGFPRTLQANTGAPHCRASLTHCKAALAPVSQTRSSMVVQWMAARQTRLCMALLLQTTAVVPLRQQVRMW